MLVVADDTAGAGGRPLFQRPAILGGGVGIEARPAAILPALSPRPNSTGVVVADGDVGVPPGSWPRRLVLSWVLQSTGPLQADRRVGWLLDPTDRLRHAAPFASWSSTALVESAGRWVWLGVGFVSAEAFPGTRKQPWLGRRVSYLRPGLVGTVDAVTGRLQIFVAHETDSLSAAWARVAGGLVRPADRLPAWLTDALDYPRMWLELHADLWMQTEAERLGRPTVELGAGAASPVPGGWAIPITDQRPGRLHAVLEGRRVGPRMELLVHRPDTLGLEAADVLERRWARFPAFQLLRDSVTAAGAQFESGNVRYVAGSEGLLAYRPSWGLRPGGEAALIMVAVARRNLVGVGRTFEDALQRLRGGDATLVSPAEGESAILFEARRWLREADSALRRGDLTAFARAFAALRTLLEGTEGR